MVPENIKNLQNKIKELEREISKLAYEQCLNGNDSSEMMNLITESYWAYRYCRDIKDRPEIWRKINTSWDAYLYCKWVKDRPEVRKYNKGIWK